MLVTHMGKLRHRHSTTRQQWWGRGGGQDSAQAVLPGRCYLPLQAQLWFKIGCSRSELSRSVLCLTGTRRKVSTLWWVGHSGASHPGGDVSPLAACSDMVTEPHPEWVWPSVSAAGLEIGLSHPVPGDPADWSTRRPAVSPGLVTWFCWL